MLDDITVLSSPGCPLLRVSDQITRSSRFKSLVGFTFYPKKCAIMVLELVTNTLVFRYQGKEK